ncbi:hypothetical protein M8J77_008782 [Diaphorina citri]|nr:hypothetical protein M8J77_008782 [Diaphorina citri]
MIDINVEQRVDGPGQWLSLDGELVMMGGEVVGTKIPTGHSILMDCRFELPFGSSEPNKDGVGSPTSSTNSDYDTLLSDRLKIAPNRLKRNSECPDPENTEGPDLQRKLELLNNIMDQEARNEQARRQYQYYGHSGYSEDSDYTSELSFPVGGQHPNSSASQFRTLANQLTTPPQPSLETSRESSYEHDDPTHDPPAYPGPTSSTGEYHRG